MRFRYAVRGLAGSREFPTVTGLPNLRQAVAIARSYPDIYGDGSATHVVRDRAVPAPLGAAPRSGSTERWRVYPDGRLELLLAYHWQRGGAEAEPVSPARPAAATALRRLLAWLRQRLIRQPWGLPHNIAVSARSTCERRAPTLEKRSQAESAQDQKEETLVNG
jgi:hypothetical protein